MLQFLVYLQKLGKSGCCRLILENYNVSHLETVWGFIFEIEYFIKPHESWQHKNKIDERRVPLSETTILMEEGGGVEMMGSRIGHYV